MNRLVKHFVLWVLLWLPLLAVGQTERFEAVVIDAQTHQTLPFAGVFVSRSNSTMTNAEGSFSIGCAPTDMLRISFVGYQTRTIVAEQMGRVVELHAVSTTLDEVTVKPYSSYLKEAIKEAQRQLKKNRKKRANFFYRQTAYADSVCYEFMEAFLSGHSSVFLRDLALSKGRFAGIQPDSLHYYSYYANFFSTSQIQVTYMPGTKVTSSDRYPLSEYYESNYDVSFDMIGSDNERLLAAHFTPKPTDKPVLDATLYLDANTYRLRKIEGRELNLKVMHRKQRGSRYEEELAALFGKDYFDELIDTEFHFVVNMTEDREFLEVESVMRAALAAKDVPTCKSLLEYLDPPKSWAAGREWLDILVVSISVAMAFRAYFYEPFNIPTGSMQPTLYGNHSVACAPEDADFFDRTPLKWLKWIATGSMYEHSG